MYVFKHKHKQKVITAQKCHVHLIQSIQSSWHLWKSRIVIMSTSSSFVTPGVAAMTTYANKKKTPPVKTKLRSWQLSGFSEGGTLGYHMTISRTTNDDEVAIMSGFHYNDVIMRSTASQITSLPIVYQTVYSSTDQRKHQLAPSHWPLWGEFTGDRWIPAQKASNAENVSIWWRHHVNASPLLQGQHPLSPFFFSSFLPFHCCLQRSRASKRQPRLASTGWPFIALGSATILNGSCYCFNATGGWFLMVEWHREDGFYWYNATGRTVSIGTMSLKGRLLLAQCHWDVGFYW